MRANGVNGNAFALWGFSYPWTIVNFWGVWFGMMEWEETAVSLTDTAWWLACTLSAKVQLDWNVCVCVCFSQVGILQYGEIAVHEWSLKDYQTTEEVVEAAKNINRQEGRETRTAYAIQMAWYDCQSFSPIILSISLFIAIISFLFFFFYFFLCVRFFIFRTGVMCVHKEPEHSIVPLSLSQYL